MKKILWACAMLLVLVGCSSKESENKDEQKEKVDSLVVQEAIPVDTLLVEGEVLPNKGLFQALDSMGVDDSISLQLVNVIRFKVDLTGMRAGERLWVRFFEDGVHIKEFGYQPNVILKHVLRLDSTNQKYNYEEERMETEVRYRKIEGLLEDGSSLNAALLAKKIPKNLTQTVNGILLCKISFRTDARAGDQWKVVLREEYYGEALIDGRVLYASYNGVRTGEHEAFRYMEEDRKSSYNAHYTSKGEALIHTGLRYPVDRLHISSSYGYRRHPVTGRRKMHRGVDYASPRGANVYAVAEGVVIKSSYDRLNGNAVAIRHADKSTSYYLHLSRRSVSRGARVRSRQVIGKVGSTGLSTGPHLHFGFKNSGGSWMNPLRKKMIATPKLKGERYQKLQVQISEIKEVLAKLEPVESVQVPDSTQGVVASEKP